MSTIAALLLSIENISIALRLLVILFLLLLQELFIQKKLKAVQPEKPVDQAQNVHDAATFEVLKELSSNLTSYQIVEKIANTKEGRYLFEKIGQEKKIINVDVQKDTLVYQAADLVKALRGKYIYPIDLLAAYILLQEESAKLFEASSLAKQDMVPILYWTRKRFFVEEERKKPFQFIGGGAFDSLVFGWTPETKNYTSDFTQEVLRLGYEPQAIGRGNEYKQLMHSLTKSSASNVLLVGEPGVGKTMLIMDFAYDSYQGTVNSLLKKKRIHFLFIDRLLSGASSKGELENRLGVIFSEIAHSGNIIIFIENIENILGGGGFDFDVSGAIQPYLSGNRIQVIATTTPQAYKDFVLAKPSVQALFNTIRIEPPNEDEALFMMIEDASIREKISGAVVTYPALKAVLSLAEVYDPLLPLPGSAAHLLEDSMIRAFSVGRRVVTANDVKEFIGEKTGVQLLDPSSEEKEKLLRLEDTMHRKLIGQDEAVSAVSNALRRVRSGLKKNNGPIASFLFLGPTGVGKTTTAKLLTEIYFGQEDKLIRVDMSEYQTQDAIGKLLGESPGEESYEESFLDKVVKDPFSVVLLDEFEKAHPRLLDIFLQILDEGFVTNNKGKRISFTHTIIIATSNAGSEFIREKLSSTEDIKDALIEYILTKGIFRPELVNRFDDVVVFHPLSKDQMVEIAKLRIHDLNEKLSKQHIEIGVSSEGLEKIASDSYDPDFGARNVRRYIEEHIENVLSRMILEEKIGKGDIVNVSLSDSGSLLIEKSSY